jgi:hypothetical protein
MASVADQRPAPAVARAALAWPGVALEAAAHSPAAARVETGTAVATAVKAGMDTRIATAERAVKAATLAAPLLAAAGRLPV